MHIETETNYPQFLQSPEWLHFQKSYGRSGITIRLGNTLILALRYPIVFGFSYWFIPRGPYTPDSVSHTEAKEILNTISTEIRRVDHKALFIRIEPTTTIHTDAWKHVRSTYLSVGTKIQSHIHPSVTRLISLTPSENEILGQMSDSTRRNISVAEKRGVIVQEETNSGGLDALWQILTEMSGRQKIHLHEKKYYHAMLEAFSASKNPSEIKASLYVARFENTPIAAGFILHYRGVTTYLHGASGNLYRDKKAQYALRWRIMKDAKNAGCHTIDFFGENPPDPSDPDYKAAWQGFTQFKMGFGGKQIRLPGTLQYPLRPFLYMLYRIAKHLR